jgi:HAD superfamily hydrolase (TIGR01509 family)
MMSFAAIIFDCDGTLVDSERVGNQALIECVGELGYTLTLDQALEYFAGRKMADTLALIEEWMGSPLPSGSLEHARWRMAQAFEEHLVAMEGVHELLSRLTSMPICVASNGPLEKMQVSMRVTGLIEHFEGRIFSAYECKVWKPEPGLFLYAASEMGVEPHTCAVIEDTAIGIEAAVAAGMTAFGYAPRSDGLKLRAAGARVFHHMNELLPLMGLDIDPEKSVAISGAAASITSYSIWCIPPLYYGQVRTCSLPNGANTIP